MLGEKLMADQIITAQKLIDADKDADSLDSFISGSETEDVVTRRGRKYPTLAKMNKLAIAMTKYGGAYSFKTIANFEENKVSVPANSSVQITNDADKNGIYTWDGLALTKSNSIYIDDFLINEGDKWSTV